MSTVSLYRAERNGEPVSDDISPAGEGQHVVAAWTLIDFPGEYGHPSGLIVVVKTPKGHEYEVIITTEELARVVAENLAG